MEEEKMGSYIVKLRKAKKTNRVRQIFLFYTIVSMIGIFIVPVFGVLAPTAILCSIMCPILGLVKLVAWILGYNVPIIIFQIGNYTINPLFGFLLSLLLGGVLYIVGMGSWKLLLKYIHGVLNKKKRMTV